MSTKTTCRIGSDADLLSRVQLDHVCSLLDKPAARNSIEFARCGDSDVADGGNTQPGTPARNAILMHNLLEGGIDALVLNAAAMPAKIPTGLTIGAITPRITPFDALICRDDCILDELEDGATIATISSRREAQMLYYRPDLRIVQVTGSVDAVVQKVRGGKFNAAVVASADMERLGRQEDIAEILTNSVCIPAAGQGALAILVRSSEQSFRDTLQSINDSTTYSTLRAEWTFLEHLGAVEDAPVGVLGIVEGKVLELEGVLAFPDGREKIHFIVKGKLGAEEDLGATLAKEILDAGGREILQELHLF